MATFTKTIPIAEWAGPVGTGAILGQSGSDPTSCFTPAVVRRANRGAYRSNYASFNRLECWRRWLKLSFSGTATYTSFVEWVCPGGSGYSETQMSEERVSGFVVYDPARGLRDNSASTALVERRYRGISSETGDTGWSAWAPVSGFPHEGYTPSVWTAEFGAFPPPTNTLTTRTLSAPPGGTETHPPPEPDDTFCVQTEWTVAQGGEITLTLSEEDTEEAMAARALAAGDSYPGFGSLVLPYAIRPEDSVGASASRQWLGIRADLAPGQEWRIFYEVVRRRLGVGFEQGGDYVGTVTQTRDWSQTLTLSDEQLAPQDVLGSMAEADPSWATIGWARGATAAASTFTQRAWLRVVAHRPDVLSVRLKKVQTGEAAAFVTLTTGASADGLMSTEPLFVPTLDHTRSATVTVEWVRDAEGLDVPAEDWTVLVKTRTGAWGRRQYNHAATVAGSRFFRKETAVWTGTAVATGGTLTQFPECGERLDLSQTATLERTWSPPSGWPSRWTLLSASGSQGGTSWSAPDIIADSGLRAWRRSETLESGVGYTLEPGWLLAPPVSSGSNWSVSAEVATYAEANMFGWGFNNSLRIARTQPYTGEVLSRSLESVVTDSTLTVGTTAPFVDYRVGSVVFGADAEGEMKEINVRWAEPVL